MKMALNASFSTVSIEKTHISLKMQRNNRLLEMKFTPLEISSFIHKTGDIDVSNFFNKKYRDSFEITALVLEAASDGTSLFAIARHVNTNYTHLRRYTDFLVKTGFINVKVDGGRILYKTSEKGFEFLRLYHTLLSMFSNTSGTRIHAGAICQRVRQSVGKI